MRLDYRTRSTRARLAKAILPSPRGAHYGLRYTYRPRHRLLIEGEGSDALVMIHGWPDTHHLWDSTVQALKPFFRCARFTLPGYDLEKPPRATPLANDPS